MLPSSPTSQSGSLRAPYQEYRIEEWGFGVIDVSIAFLKSQPLGRNIYASPPLFSGEYRRVAESLISTVLFIDGLSGMVRNVKSPLTDLGGKVTLLDKSVL